MSDARPRFESRLSVDDVRERLRACLTQDGQYNASDLFGGVSGEVDEPNERGVVAFTLTANAWLFNAGSDVGVKGRIVPSYNGPGCHVDVIFVDGVGGGWASIAGVLALIVAVFVPLVGSASVSVETVFAVLGVVGVLVALSVGVRSTGRARLRNGLLRAIERAAGLEA